jgi:FkbM family methyltransferase
MKAMRRLVRRILVGCLVGPDTTAVRSGRCRGRLLPREIAAGNLSMVSGRYERAIQRALETQARGCRIAYDVGAHVGFFTLFLSQVVRSDGLVHAFEPSAPEARLLRELIRCNHLEERIAVHECAVCDEDGQVSFNVGHASSTGILHKAPANRSAGDRPSCTVRSVTLDHFVYGMGNPAPDVMKIDVESAETLVLRGASRLLREHRPRMLIELHGPKACQETVSLLLADGYRIETIAHPRETAVTTPDQLRPLFNKDAWTTHIVAVPS